MPILPDLKHEMPQPAASGGDHAAFPRRERRPGVRLDPARGGATPWEANLAEFDDWLSRYRPFGRTRLRDGMEAAFVAEGRESQRRVAVLGLSMGLLLCIVLLPFDWVVDRLLLGLNLMIRLGICAPLIAAMLWIVLDRGRSARTHRLAATAAACGASATFSFVFAHSETVAGLAYLSVNVCVMSFAACLLGVTTKHVVAICVACIASMVTAAGVSPVGGGAVALSFGLTGTVGAIPCILANHWLQNERRRNFVVMRRDELRLERIAQQQAMMEKLAAIDPLTQVANRRGFDAQLDDALAHSADGSLAVAMIDVDFFKPFNDTYGHPKGDDVLRAIALVMVETCGSIAQVGRLGGEEFAVAAVGTAADDFAAMMEKLRGSIEGLQIPHRRSEAARVVTVSIGIASGTAPDLAGRGHVFKGADTALYEAKSSGRNRVHRQRRVLPAGHAPSPSGG